MTAPLLSVRALAVRRGGALAVSDVSFDLAAGASLALMGANGAGKSSLLRALIGLEPATGEVWFDGTRLGQAAASRARRGIGFLPEGRRIFAPLSVAENLAVGVAGGRRARQAAIDATLALFPPLAARWHMPAGNLSGGEQTMLALARLLARRPRLALLDEPAAGLAPDAADAALDALNQARRDGVALIFAEHRRDWARRLADRVLWLEAGRVVGETAASALVEPPTAELQGH